MDDLYEITSDCGLDDRRNNHKIVTKLWMTSCKHIICDKHLPAGLAFHPQYKYPKVPCPFCPSGHETTLFWIRGTDHGQHDPTIPSNIFEELECVSFKSKDHETLALEVHYRGAIAAAKLFATQTHVAVELLHKSKQCIETLEQENTSLKAKFYNLSRSPPTNSHGEFVPSSPRTHQSVGPNRSESSRLTLKRPFQLSSSIVKNARVCLPEYGVLHAYGTPQSIGPRRDTSTSRITELGVQASPAFSTPYLRTGTLTKYSSLSLC